MDTVFVAMVWGSWGKGRTLEQAKRNMRRAGGTGKARVWCITFPLEHEYTDPSAEVSVNDMGDIYYPKSCAIAQV